LWASIVDGIPANVCVDACLTLQHAYVQLGIRAELQPVGLVIRDERGREKQYAGLEPSWSGGGTVFHGHGVLMLPDSQRVVDATVEQLDKVRELRKGPLIGKVAASTSPLEVGELLEARSCFSAGSCCSSTRSPKRRRRL
jgi:hypothetical protein